jgi:hypothetical protein
VAVASMTYADAAIRAKLVAIAGGNIELVQEAIRACAPDPTKPADLERVVLYLRARRAPP